jgi:hypothetical protein
MSGDRGYGEAQSLAALVLLTSPWWARLIASQLRSFAYDA